MPIYQELIMYTTGCTKEEASKIEELMRKKYRTLSDIDHATFRREAQWALRTIHLQMAN